MDDKEEYKEYKQLRRDLELADVARLAQVEEMAKARKALKRRDAQLNNAVKLLAAMDNVLPVHVRVQVQDAYMVRQVEEKKAIGTLDDCWVEIRDPGDFPPDVAAEACRLAMQCGGYQRTAIRLFDGQRYSLTVTPIVVASALLKENNGPS